MLIFFVYIFYILKFEYKKKKLFEVFRYKSVEKIKHNPLNALVLNIFDQFQ